MAPSRQRIVEAYETRVALETTAARLSAVRGDEPLRQQLMRLADGTVQAAERQPHDFRETDKAFHAAVIEGAESSYLAELAKGALVMTAVLRARDVPTSGDSVQCAYEHVDIAQAIAAGEDDRASDVMRLHIEHVQRNLLSAFDEVRRAGDAT